MNTRFLAALPFFALLFSVTAEAQLAPTDPDPTAPASTRVPRPDDSFETPRGIALGTGARASAMGTSGAVYNAAGMGAGRLYHLEGVSDFMPKGGGWSVGGLVADSVTSRLAAGLAFRGVFDRTEANYSGYDGKLSLGFPFSNAISVGIAGRYFKFTPDDDADARRLRGFTLDVSLRIQPVSGVTLAALGYNLIDKNTSLVPQLVGGGASYAITDSILIGGDALVDLSTFDKAAVIAGGGLEYLVGGQMPLRLGYRFDSGREIHSITGGIGYLDRSFGLEAAVRHDITGDERDTRLIFSFRYHVQ